MVTARRALWVCSVLCAAGLAAASVALGEAAPLGELEKLLDRQQAAKESVQGELSQLGERRAQLRGALRQHASALYRLQRGGLLPLAGGLDALLSHASHLSRLERLVHRDLAALEALRKRGHALREETAELAAKLERTRSSLAEVSKQRPRRARVVEQDGAFEQTFEVSRGPTGRTIRTPTGTLSLLGDEAHLTRFAEQRGNLALPVSGPQQLREAYRAHSDGAGLELVARGGSTVRACAAGRVAFAEEYAAYGRLVILDHGDRYYTVYAGLEQITVRVGDDLSRSARLGTVGADGVLYFEVRRGTRNLPPRPWLGL